MKKFFVAVCCTLMFGVSVMAQDTAPVTPPVPVEDVPAAAATPAPAPAAQSSVVQAAPYGTVNNAGCINCGGSTVMSTTPMATTSGCCPTPCATPCCGTQMTYTAAPVQTPCCGQVAPAPVAATDCCAPVDPCCQPDPCCPPKRVGFLAKRRAKRAAKNCCY